jgi:hypothetical protein
MYKLNVFPILISILFCQVKPEGASDVSHYMAQDEIQWIVSRVSAKRLRDEWFDENVDTVVRLQSIARMSLARKRYELVTPPPSA